MGSPEDTICIRQPPYGVVALHPPTEDHGAATVNKTVRTPPHSNPPRTSPGISAPTAATPAPIEPEFMLSLEERALIEGDAARNTFRAFQEVKDEIPLRPAETERLKQWAILAAESYLKIQKAREKETSQAGPSPDLSRLHEEVLAAERLLRQAKETERGLGETASDHLVVAINDAKAAKATMETLRLESRQGQSHPSEEMSRAQDAVTATNVRLRMAAENNVEAWRRASAVAVVDDPAREGDEVRACAEGRDRAEAEKRKLDQEGI
jgi:hypothetical protein